MQRFKDDIRQLMDSMEPAWPPVSIRGETAIWRAVIVQALMDAASRSQKPTILFHKHEAAAWLTGNSRDFVTVCEHAGFDHSYIRRMAKRALLGGCKWRAGPGEGRQRSCAVQPPRPAMNDDEPGGAFAPACAGAAL